MSDSINHIQQVLNSAEQLYSADEVDVAYAKLAAQITTVLKDRAPIILSVLTGGLIPTGNLITRMDFPLQLDYLHATRYHGGTRGTDLDWLARPSIAMKDRTVLVVDDILDEGLTLDAILNYCEEQGAQEVFSAVLVEKQHDRRSARIKATFKGLDVDDRYVFGCGMDYKGYWRNLPEIYAITL